MIIDAVEAADAVAAAFEHCPECVGRPGLMIDDAVGAPPGYLPAYSVVCLHAADCRSIQKLAALIPNLRLVRSASLEQPGANSPSRAALVIAERDVRSDLQEQRNECADNSDYVK